MTYEGNQFATLKNIQIGTELFTIDRGFYDFYRVMEIESGKIVINKVKTHIEGSQLSPSYVISNDKPVALFKSVNPNSSKGRLCTSRGQRFRLFKNPIENPIR